MNPRTTIALLALAAAMLLVARKVPRESAAASPAPHAVAAASLSLRRFSSSSRSAPGWSGEVAAARAIFAAWRELDTGDDLAREKLLAELSARVSDAALAAFARTLSIEEANSELGLAILRRWLELDAKAAADWIAWRGSGTEAEALLIATALVRGGTKLDPYAAALEEPAWKNVFLATAAKRVACDDPACAIALAQRMENGDARTDTLETAANAWMARDPLAATKWIEGGDDAELRERLRDVAARAIALEDPELAADWLAAATTTQNSPDRESTWLCVVETWAGREPARAAAWVARFSEPAGRAAAIDLLASEWRRTDPAALEAWVATLPDREAILARWQKAQADAAQVAVANEVED